MSKISTRHKRINSTSFSGTIEEFRQFAPEECVDNIINILKLDPKQDTKPYLPDWPPVPLKEKIWNDLASIFHRFNIPTPSEADTISTSMHSHAQMLHDIISTSLENLKGLEYEELYKHGEINKKFKYASMLRHQSEQLNSRKQGRAAQYFADGFAQQTKDGQWPKLYQFDSELLEAIKALEKIAPYFEKTSEYYKTQIPKQGAKSKAKKNSDNLIVCLCDLYKNLTGEEPIAYQDKYTDEYKGAIIPFLQAILPSLPYNQEITDSALNSRVYRLKKSGKYQSVFGHCTKK